MPSPVTTDADGRFRLTGLGRDRQATLAISGPTIAFRGYQVVTRRMKPVKSPGPGGTPTLRSEFLRRRLHDRGRAGPADRGRRPRRGYQSPDPGCDRHRHAACRHAARFEGLIATTTDADGRYRLVGLPKAIGHNLIVYPPLNRPYFITEFLKVPAGPGLGPVQYDIALKRGIWITGRVADANTRKPVQAAIHYYPFLANDRSRGTTELPSEPHVVPMDWQPLPDRCRGSLPVVGLPGHGILAAKTFDRSYRLGVGADTIPEKPTIAGDREEGLPTYNHIHPIQFQVLAAIDPPAVVEEFHHDLVLQPIRIAGCPAR